MLRRRTRGEAVFDGFLIVFMILLAIIMLYPFWHVLVRSVLPLSEAIKGDLFLFPTKIDLSGYAKVFSSDKLLNAFGVSIAIAVFGTIYQVFCTAMAAFALTKKDLPMRNGILTFMVITMFFGGGLIPYYMVIKNLGLIDNFLVFIVTGTVNVYNIIVMKTFFNGLPVEMEESAQIDGAGYFTVFTRIILPLSKPVISTISLFIVVGNWNNWFTGLLFIQRATQLKPLALVLRDILINNNVDLTQRAAGQPVNDYALDEMVKMAVIIVSILPIVAIYPFLQKYFVKGVMIGSLKG